VAQSAPSCGLRRRLTWRRRENRAYGILIAKHTLWSYYLGLVGYNRHLAGPNEVWTVWSVLTRFCSAGIVSRCGGLLVHRTQKELTWRRPEQLERTDKRGCSERIPGPGTPGVYMALGARPSPGFTLPSGECQPTEFLWSLSSRKRLLSRGSRSPRSTLWSLDVTFCIESLWTHYYRPFCLPSLCSSL
jgi:hypothetical protein